MNRYLILLMVIIGSSCSQKTTTTSSAELNSTNIEKAYEALDVTPVKFEKNSNGSYILATFQDEGAIPGSVPLRVAVINVETSEVVYRKNLNNGSVKWLSDYTIEIVAPPGMPEDNQVSAKDYTYVVDVRTGEKVKPLKVKIID